MAFEAVFKISTSLNKCLLSTYNLIHSVLGPILHTKHSSPLLKHLAARTKKLDGYFSFQNIGHKYGNCLRSKVKKAQIKKPFREVSIIAKVFL